MPSILQEIFSTDPNIDSRSIAFLIKALEKANTPGFDYLEFKEALAAQSKLGMDDATAFKSTFATAATIGLNKTKLIASTKHYLNILKEQKKLFDQAVEKRLEEKVNLKEKDNQDLNDKVKALQNKITEINLQLTKLNQQIKENSQGIESEMIKIKETKNDFEKALNGILQQIEEDLTKIENWLN